MSSKDHEKMDGVFEKSSKTEVAKPDKPTRPPKSKASLSRETKVGLAVIGALLVIFVVVLVLRFRGGSGEEVTATQTSPSNGAEKPKKQQPKATPAESRTLIASQSGATGAEWPGTTGARAGNLGRGTGGAGNVGAGSAGGGSFRSGSAYNGSPYSGDDPQTRGGTPAGYLPSNTPRGSPFSAGAGELPTAAGAKPDVDSPLRLNQPDLQKQPNGATNRFPIQSRTEVETASASAADEAVASDEAAPNDSAETQVDAAAADPFSKRPGGQPVNGLGVTSPSIGIERRQELQPQDSTSAQVFGNAPGHSHSDDTDLGEAEKFVPSRFQADTGADRLVGNNSTENRGDDSDEQVNTGHSANPSKLTSVKGLDISDRQPNLASAEGDVASDSPLPFRKPQGTAAPARLDDVALDGNGPATLPIQGEAADDRARRYAVADGDTYWSIAKRTYHSGAYFKALYEHNRRQLNNAGSLRSGMQLMLPDEATLQRLYPTLCPRPQRVAAATRATRASATLPADGHEHVVSEGDTLYDVARRRLGKASRWAEIYELNRDEIGAASDRLEPGTRLALPAKD